MAIMSEKDTYTNNINDTDERGGDSPKHDDTASLEHGDADLPDHDSAALLEHDNAEPFQRGGTTPPEHGGPELSHHDSATSPERDNAVSSEHGDTASPERGSAELTESNDAQPGSSAGEPVTSDAFTESATKPAVSVGPDHGDNATEPDATNGPNHAAGADEVEAASRADHAEEAPFDERSAAHSAKATSDEHHTAHAAKPMPVEHRASHAVETASAYLQKAGDFLGLHKKATAIAAAVALCAVVGIGAAVASNSKPSPNGALLGSGFANYAANAVATTTDAAADEAAAGLVAQRLTPDALNSIDSFASAPGTFSLIEGEDAAPLSEEQQESLAAATQNIEGGGYTVGFTLINLNTGKGIAYNLDSRVYGASSFKGPYAAYLCQHLGDNDVSYPSGSEAAGSGVSSSIYSLMQPMILYSDNNAFSSLRNSYDSAGFAEWLNSCGVDSEIMHDTHFPRYSARESALLWLHTYQYLKTNTPTAQNLASLYEQTNVSFIRSGVSDDEGVEVVLNKAGWCAGRERFTGLCDAGLIKCTNGTTYLMSTMTNSPDGGLYTVRLANLASALFECRDVLE